MTVLRFSTTVRGETSKISYLLEFSAEVSEIVFSAPRNHVTAFHNIRSFNSKNVITLRAQCTSITNRVFSSFDRFTAFYNCTRKNFKNLIISMISVITSIDDSCSQLIWPFYGLLQLYDEKNLKNLISPWVQCTGIINRVFKSIDRFSAYYNCKSWNFKNSISPWVQCRSIRTRFFQLFWPFYGFSQLYQL